MPANERLAEIHNAKQRMPLILPPEAVDTGLTGTPEQATDLLVPYPSELMLHIGSAGESTSRRTMTRS